MSLSFAQAQDTKDPLSAFRDQFHIPKDEEGNEIITIQPVAEPGDEVEIADGPLQGMTGTVIEVRSAEERVRIFIEFLGQDQPVDVDLYSLLLPRRPAPKQKRSS